MHSFHFSSPSSSTLNLRSLASLDLTQLVNTTNIDLLQEHIENITYSKIDGKTLSDDTINVLIRLYQCTIEYLLYVQNYFNENNQSMTLKYDEVVKEKKEVENKLKVAEENNNKLGLDLKYYKKLAHSLEMFHPTVAAINPNSTPLNVIAAPNIPENPFMPISDKGRKCHGCSSCYSSAEYLYSHYLRRHPELKENATQFFRTVNQVQVPIPQPQVIQQPLTVLAGNNEASNQLQVETLMNGVMSHLDNALKNIVSEVKQTSSNTVDELRKQIQHEMRTYQSQSENQVKILEEKLENVKLNIRMKNDRNSLQLVPSVQQPILTNGISNATSTFKSGMSDIMEDTPYSESKRIEDIIKNVSKQVEQQFKQKEDEAIMREEIRKKLEAEEAQKRLLIMEAEAKLAKELRDKEERDREYKRKLEEDIRLQILKERDSKSAEEKKKMEEDLRAKQEELKKKNELEELALQKRIDDARRAIEKEELDKKLKMEEESKYSIEKEAQRRYEEMRKEREARLLEVKEAERKEVEKGKTDLEIKEKLRLEEENKAQEKKFADLASRIEDEKKEKEGRAENEKKELEAAARERKIKLIEQAAAEIQARDKARSDAKSLLDASLAAEVARWESSNYLSSFRDYTSNGKLGPVRATEPLPVITADLKEFVLDEKMSFLPLAAVAIQREWTDALSQNISSTVDNCTKEMLLEQEQTLNKTAAGLQVVETMNTWIDDIVKKYFRPSGEQIQVHTLPMSPPIKARDDPLRRSLRDSFQAPPVNASGSRVSNRSAVDSLRASYGSLNKASLVNVFGEEKVAVSETKLGMQLNPELVSDIKPLGSEALKHATLERPTIRSMRSPSNKKYDVDSFFK